MTMHWNYRVVEKVTERSPDAIDVQYSIHEIYYQDGHPYLWSTTPQTPYGETLEELQADLQRMLNATEKPLLKWDELPGNQEIK